MERLRRAEEQIASPSSSSARAAEHTHLVKNSRAGQDFFFQIIKTVSILYKGQPNRLQFSNVLARPDKVNDLRVVDHLLQILSCRSEVLCRIC